MQTFGRNLRAVLPGLRTVRPRDADGDERQRRFQGVSLKTRTYNGSDRGPSRPSGEMRLRSALVRDPTHCRPWSGTPSGPPMTTLSLWSEHCSGFTPRTRGGAIPTPDGSESIFLRSIGGLSDADALGRYGVSYGVSGRFTSAPTDQ